MVESIIILVPRLVGRALSFFPCHTRDIRSIPATHTLHDYGKKIFGTSAAKQYFISAVSNTPAQFAQAFRKPSTRLRNLCKLSRNLRRLCALLQRYTETVPEVAGEEGRCMKMCFLPRNTLL
jgi:hypothetical protein